MAELTLKERLQPSLLDRLIDDGRVVAETIVRVPLATLRAEQVAATSVAAALAPYTRAREDDDPAEADEQTELKFRLTAAAQAAGAARVRGLRVPSELGTEVPLERLAVLESRAVRNVDAEAPEARLISMRQLRDIVYRDLVALLNAVHLAAFEDLSELPHVASSTLNFGVPSYAGRATSIDAHAVAEEIRLAIERFEPRLRAVRVTPESNEDKDKHIVSFRIEADLWGQPAPQHVVLRSEIHPDTGDVTVSPSGA